jgi:dienelactone hydrolase
VQNMLGAYGEWAAALQPDPPRLSFRRAEWKNVEDWQGPARLRFREALRQPDSGSTPQPTLQHHIEYDGLAIEHLHWQLPYGPPTEALVLKPAGAGGRLPAVLALHDHGGNKYFGLRKITRISNDVHPLIERHQEHYYSGVAWANELAKRGYVVLVHDAFAFGSRRVRAADLPEIIRDHLVETNPEDPEEIERYNAFAANHEHIVAKSLFCAGTTWPGVFTGEDQRALDYLCSRPDVDTARVGCGGLSGGGLRTVYLTGLDERIRCSCCVGMMTTWRDYMLNKCYTHTWMVYVPGLPSDLDYPEILGLNLPHPMLVLNNHEDQLFTVPEMQRADRMLTEIHRKAGTSDRYMAKFYPGPHKFDREMQAQAFQWFDRWLKA